MNINIKWLKRRTKKVEDKYKMDAYLRTYTIDKDGNRTQPQKRLKGVIIGLEDDLRLTRALSVTTDIDFYKYKVNFKLYK